MVVVIGRGDSPLASVYRGLSRSGQPLGLVGFVPLTTDGSHDPSGRLHSGGVGERELSAFLATGALPEVRWV